MDKAKLEAKLEQLLAQERQAFANFNAVLGARQFCEQLIKELESRKQEMDAHQHPKSKRRGNHARDLRHD